MRFMNEITFAQVKNGFSFVSFNNFGLLFASSAYKAWDFVFKLVSGWAVERLMRAFAKTKPPRDETLLFMNEWMNRECIAEKLSSDSAFPKPQDAVTTRLIIGSHRPPRLYLRGFH